jgi:tetratricopeptide (TPR) repeat protein
MKKYKSIFLLLFVIIESCATKTATKTDSRKMDDINSSSPASGELIVMQTGAKSPMISGSDVTHWIQLRDSDNSRNRLYGMLATGNWVPAVDEARKELEKTPGDNSLLIALAAGFAGQRNYELSAYYSSQVLKSSPANSDAMNFIGLRIMTGSNNRRADFDQALTWFRKAADNDGTHIAALLNMGNLQLDLGDGAGAIESFSLASNRCGQCFAAQYGYGISSSRTGAWSQAKTAFENILSQDNSRAEAQYELAVVFKNGLNDPKRATTLLQDIVSDADGRFKHAGRVKSVANITLRRMKASDRSAPMPQETVVPHGDEMPARAE